MDKRELRKELIKERDNIPDRSVKSGLITDKLLSLPEYIGARTVFCFLSFGSEVDTTVVIRNAIAGKILYVPKIIDKAMHTVKIDLSTTFERGAFGIMEPCAPPSDIVPDIIIVPSVALSYSFDRLGYGAGYYDKYMADKKSVKIAVNYECLLLTELPSQSHDIAVDIIITEQRIIRRTYEK